MSETKSAPPDLFPPEKELERLRRLYDSLWLHRDELQRALTVAEAQIEDLKARAQRAEERVLELSSRR